MQVVSAAAVRFVVGMLCVLLLSSCTTYVAGVKKDASYNKQLTETAILWVPPVNLKTRIKITAQGYRPTITEKAKESSAKHIAELIGLFSEHAPRAIGKALGQRHVNVISKGGAAATQLLVHPTFSETECVPIGCQHSIWLQVVLVDKAEKKPVWEGSFKVGSPVVRGTNDESVVQNFVESLISQLKGSKLL